MLVTIKNVLGPEQIRQCRQALSAAAWTDGRATAGHQAVQVKQNRQLAPDDPLTLRLEKVVLDALGNNPQFIAAALPLKVFPPMFNRYEGGGRYGNHIDSSVLSVPGTPHRVRTDISATLFFSEPDEYDGGELIIEDTYGTHQVRLPAGHMVLYPGTSLHRVTPVTRGARLASFFWIQSLIRDDNQRTLLWQLDNAIQQLSLQVSGSPQLEQLTGIYHNLIRQWSNT